MHRGEIPEMIIRQLVPSSTAHALWKLCAIYDLEAPTGFNSSVLSAVRRPNPTFTMFMSEQESRHASKGTRSEIPAKAWDD